MLEAVTALWFQRGGGAGVFGPHVALPWPHDERWGLIVINGCDALDADRQYAAFALFVQAATCGTPVLAAGKLPPVDLPLREDLRTRPIKSISSYGQATCHFQHEAHHRRRVADQRQISGS